MPEEKHNLKAWPEYMAPADVVKMMDLVEDENELEGDYESDARHNWPTRWHILRNRLIDMHDEIQGRKYNKQNQADGQ